MSTAERRQPRRFDQPCAATWLHLLLRDPPSDERVLVTGERVLYKRRRHWMSLGTPLLRTLALYVIAFQLVLGLRGIGWFGGLLLVGAVVVVLGWLSDVPRRVALTALGGCVAVGVLAGGVHAPAVVVALGGTGSFVVRLVEHRCYSFLYVTNRRLIATKGIFTRDVSTMPIRRITDVRLSMTWLGETLEDLDVPGIEGYGVFLVESAGQNQALGRLPWLVDPHYFNETVLLLATTEARIESDGT